MSLETFSQGVVSILLHVVSALTVYLRTVSGAYRQSHLNYQTFLIQNYTIVMHFITNIFCKLKHDRFLAFNRAQQPSWGEQKGCPKWKCDEFQPCLQSGDQLQRGQRRPHVTVVTVIGLLLSHDTFISLRPKAKQNKKKTQISDSLRDDDCSHPGTGCSFTSSVEHFLPSFFSTTPSSSSSLLMKASSFS